MARTYTPVGWQDGTVLQPAKVTVEGTEYEVEPQVVSGQTPINASNLRKMDNEIERIIEEDIPSVYDEKLIAISDTAPSECAEGDKYYNTSNNKIYVATGTNTWSQDGDTPIEGKLYILFSEQSTYAYNGTTLVSVGGGSGSSDIIIIGDESEATEDTKLIIEEEDINLDMQGTDFLNEYSTSTEKGYSANYMNNQLSKFGKLLWTGNFTSNSIHVQGISKYKLVLVIVGGAPCIGTPELGGCSFGQYAAMATVQYSYRFEYDEINENLTITYNAKGGIGTANEQQPIQAIYGIF